MPNNPTQDMYRPAAAGSEFEEHNFDEIPEGEIFRFNADDEDMSLYRKENETEALDVKTRITHAIAGNIKVYTKI